MLFTKYNDYLNALGGYHYENYLVEDIEHIHEHKCRLFIRLEIKKNASYETEWSEELLEIDIYKEELDKEAKQYIS